MRDLFLVIVAGLTVVILDLFWLGMLMSRSYNAWLGTLARRAPDGSLDPNWFAAALVYVCLGLGVVYFVWPAVKGSSLAMQFAWGAFFGVLVYGVYDLTNFSTLRDWPVTLVIVDMLWGGVVGGTTTLVVATIARRL
jgi:uncharacterized membrane protein